MNKKYDWLYYWCIKYGFLIQIATILNTQNRILIIIKLIVRYSFYLFRTGKFK